MPEPGRLLLVGLVVGGLSLSSNTTSDDPRSRRPLVVGAAGVVVVLVVVAALVWFLKGNPDEQRNTSGFAPPRVTQASFCDGVRGFQAGFASLDPSSDPTAYVGQVRTAADRLRSAGVPADIPADAKAGLTTYLHALLTLPDSATPQQISRLRTGGTATEQRQRRALDAYLATECPAGG